MRIWIKLKIHFVTISDTIDTDPKEKILSTSIRLDISMFTTEFHNSPRHRPYTCYETIATAGLSTGTRAIACEMARLIAAVAVANAGHSAGTGAVTCHMTGLVAVIAVANAGLSTGTRAIACKMARLITVVAVATGFAISVAVSVTRTNI